jgi:hypothetical protein
MPAIVTVAYAAALVALFLATAFIRFMMLRTGFANDHFLHLAGAQQMLLGEWPTRDFLDPGQPLMYAASALAQVLLGRTLFAEGVLVALGFAVAAVLTAAAVRELTGSRMLGLVAAGLEVAIVPRAYGYPKLLLYSAAFLLLQRYMTRPTRGRLFALASTVAIAFLFRHDHGIYLAAGGALAAWLARSPVGRIGGVRPALTFLGMVAALTAPYALYVAVYSDVWSYLHAGLEFRRVELARQSFASPSLVGDRPLEAALFYAYWALPVAALLAALVPLHRVEAGKAAARGVPIAAVALLVNWTFLRDPLTGRLQDAIVPAVTLLSWLLYFAWRSRYRWVWRPASALMIVAAAHLVTEIGATADHLARAGLFLPWTRWSRIVHEVTANLQAPYAERMLPSRPAVALQSFYPYVRRCTTADHRLLVIGSATEVLIFAQRGFAGGQSAFVQGYYEAEAYQRAALNTMARQVVPFVVIPGSSYTGDYSASFPLVARHIADRYMLMATFGRDPATGAQVLFDPTLPIRRRDEETGWPCLT